MVSTKAKTTTNQPLNVHNINMLQGHIMKAHVVTVFFPGSVTKKNYI